MTRGRFALATLAITTGCSAKPVAESPPPSQGTRDRISGPACPDGPRTYLKANTDGDLEVRSDPGATKYDELAIVDWRDDLNGDLALDVGLTFMGSTGSKGESMTGVFVACGGDEFVAVWGPDYIFAIELAPDAETTEQPPGTWRELISVVRHEQADREQADRIEKKTLRFEQGRYREAP